MCMKISYECPDGYMYIWVHRCKYVYIHMYICICIYVYICMLKMHLFMMHILVYMCKYRFKCHMRLTHVSWNSRPEIPNHAARGNYDTRMSYSYCTCMYEDDTWVSRCRMSFAHVSWTLSPEIDLLKFESRRTAVEWDFGGYNVAVCCSVL